VKASASLYAPSASQDWTFSVTRRGSPVLPPALDELIPSAWHHVERYASAGTIDSANSSTNSIKPPDQHG
jgi:hypothetical protein